MSARTARAILWFDRGSVIEAEAELRAALAEGEDTAETRAMLALCLLRSGLPEPAAQEIKSGLAKDPGCAFVHYANSYVEEAELEFVQIPFLGLSPLDGAKARACLKSIVRAVELEPDEVRFLLRLAEVQRVLFNRWREALSAAEQALALEPNHLGAAIERATALSHLRRKAEARETLASALAANPDSSEAHAGVGWALLHAGDHAKAKALFDEALRLNAVSDWAQAGALEAAKHRYRSYRVIATVKYWFIHQPVLLRLIYGLSAVVGAGALLVGIMKAFDPVVRPRLGNEGTALVMVPLMFAVILSVMFHDAIFAWLVRRQPAGQTSSAAVQRTAVSEQLGILIPGLIGATVLGLLKWRAPSSLPVLFGLLPGVWSLWLAFAKTPPGNLRLWLTAYAVLLLIIGPLTATSWREWFAAHDRMWSFVAMIAPIVPPGIVHEFAERARRQQAHDDAVAAVSREPH